MFNNREISFCDIPKIDQIATTATDPQTFKPEDFRRFDDDDDNDDDDGLLRMVPKEKDQKISYFDRSGLRKLRHPILDFKLRS